MSRTIYLLPIWAFVACSRVNFTLHYFYLRCTNYMHIYLYKNIFTTLFLHVSMCYTPSSGRAQNHMLFYEVVIYGDLSHRVYNADNILSKNKSSLPWK